MIALPQNSTDLQSHELQSRVALFLKQRQVTVGGRVVVSADRGVVTLSGQVPTYYQRQLVFTLASRVAGVVRVIDQLEVPPPVSPPSRPSRPHHPALLPV